MGHALLLSRDFEGIQEFLAATQRRDSNRVFAQIHCLEDFGRCWVGRPRVVGFTHGS